MSQSARLLYSDYSFICISSHMNLRRLSSRRSGAYSVEEAAADSAGRCGVERADGKDAGIGGEAQSGAVRELRERSVSNLPRLYVAVIDIVADAGDIAAVYPDV